MNIAQETNVERFGHGIKNLNEINKLNADKNVEVLAINDEIMTIGQFLIRRYDQWSVIVWYAKSVPKINNQQKSSMVHSIADQ